VCPLGCYRVFRLRKRALQQEYGNHEKGAHNANGQTNQQINPDRPLLQLFAILRYKKNVGLPFRVRHS